MCAFISVALPIILIGDKETEVVIYKYIENMTEERRHKQKKEFNLPNDSKGVIKMNRVLPQR